MGASEQDYWVPEHVRAYLQELGYVLPLEAMEPYIRTWGEWMEARGSFYDYRDSDGFGHVYEVHRRSIMPAARVCREWGSLLMNDKTSVACDSAECTEWLARFFNETGFIASAQATIVRAFGLGTGAWAVWLDLDAKRVRVRRYDARMVIPLTWDEDGVTECAFVTRAFYRGKPVDQLQMHLKDGSDAYASWRELSGDEKVLSAGCSSPAEGNVAASSPSDFEKNDEKEFSAGRSLKEDVATYRITTLCFDENGTKVEPVGVCLDYDTGCITPTFALISPAIDNTCVDMSPYGKSVFADAVDAIQAVDLAFDALINEVDVSKMRIFLSDVMFDMDRDGKKGAPIPFGKNDCTVFRKVMSTEDTIQEFAPALRTASQSEAFRIALQMLGDLTGFGITYFDFDNAGYVKTATEVSSDNSALMRNITRHEHMLEGALRTIAKAMLHCARSFGEQLPDEGNVRVIFDDSIISDTAAEKAQDMDEVGVTMHPWEYRHKWYGEDETTAKKRSRGLGGR